MTRSLSARIRTLERQAAQRAAQDGPCVVYIQLGESAAEALARAAAAGLAGGVLVLPETMEPDAWAELAPRQQRELLEQSLLLVNSPMTQAH